jgi:GH24 family phage-related lysozyme (muramidase)
MVWVKGGGVVLPGLVKRRVAEKELFLSSFKNKDEEDDN